MIIAMSLLVVVATASFGGPTGALRELNAVEGFMDWFPKDLAVPGIAGGVLFALSWLFAGLSVIGQPHIMVRFMTLEDTGMMRRARLWYYGWFTGFYLLATIVGMLSRIYLTDTANFDAELALPTMAQQLLPGFGAGVILAGIFAATMSTADSLILGCSSAITHDLVPQKIENTRVIKMGTVLITLAALLWALLNRQSVFQLVILAWSGLASAFAPLLIALCLGFRPSKQASIVAVITGLTVALLWRFLGWHDFVYEGMPGILVGLAVIGIALSLETRKHGESGLLD
jgi:Na+/proline symporter